MQLTIGLVGVEATSSVGSITPADSVGLTGQAATSTVGSLTSNELIVVDFNWCIC